MRSLTLTQPWCGLVASGIKRVENRPRHMIKREDFGVPFALHASREIDDAVYARILDLAPELGALSRRGDTEILTVPADVAAWFKLSRITSAVIAVATIDSVLDPVAHGIGTAELPDDQRRWFFGPIGYVLRDVRVLDTPVYCRGWQGFWRLTPDVECAVSAQIARGA